MASSNDGEMYVSVDIEAAGPIAGTYSMLSLGACVVGTPATSFYVELKPINANAVAEALAISRFSLSELAQKGEDPHVAMAGFRDWVREVVGERRPVFVGFNAAFDWSFVNWYFHTYLEENPFGFAPLDIKAFYMGMTGCLWNETSSRKLPLQFQPTDWTAEHHALSDARAQAETFEKLLAAARSPQQKQPSKG